ncbi:MAG: hypothetical protein ACI7YS_13775 [Flavobacterium sp.]
MKKYLFVIAYLFLYIQSNAQVFTNKEVGKKNQVLIDSLKTTDYPYVLPIWGDKAAKAGFNLPYSAGLGINYLWQESDLIIDNLRVGFNNGPMYNIDNIIRFDKAIATTNSVSFRPDIWLFPFLNIYSILGKTHGSTEIGAGVWVPDPAAGSETKILDLHSKVEFDATTFGIGMTPTIGVGGGFLALDMNCAWTDVPQLSKPTFTYVFGPRLGKNFKLSKPERAVTVWAGGFRVHLKSATNGSIGLGEVFPAEEWNTKIQNGKIKVDEAQQKVDEAQQKVDDWWSTADQNSPVNKAKYEAANNALNTAGQVLGAAEVAVGNISNSSVQYAMDKAPKDQWNFILGSQYQFSKSWMIRAEVGFLSSRTQVLTGLQYRFGL